LFQTISGIAAILGGNAVVAEWIVYFDRGPTAEDPPSECRQASSCAVKIENRRSPWEFGSCGVVYRVCDDITNGDQVLSRGFSAFSNNVFSRARSAKP
jgi:hypothetical protein